MKKEFIIEISNIVTLPYDESLLDGKVNKNHLMYLSQVELDKCGFSSSKAIYKHRIRTIDTEGKATDKML